MKLKGRWQLEVQFHWYSTRELNRPDVGANKKIKVHVLKNFQSSEKHIYTDYIMW